MLILRQERFSDVKTYQDGGIFASISTRSVIVFFGKIPTRRFRQNYSKFKINTSEI